MNDPVQELKARVRLQKSFRRRFKKTNMRELCRKHGLDVGLVCKIKNLKYDTATGYANMVTLKRIDKALRAEGI